MKKSGFTVVEILVTLTLVGIILVLLAPSFYSNTVRAHSDSASTTLLSAINLTRSEAIKQQRFVSLCPSNDGQTCSTQWENLLIIFSDEDQAVIRQFHLGREGHLSFRAFPSADALTFAPTGMTHSQNGTFDFYTDSSKVLWQVVINKAGRVHLVELD